MTLEQIQSLMDHGLLNHVESIDKYMDLTIQDLVDKEIITHTYVLEILKSLDITTEPEDEPTTEPEDEPTIIEPEDEPTTEPEDEPTIIEPEDEPTTEPEDEIVVEEVEE